MPRYHVHYSQVHTVGENVALPGDKPGDQKVITGSFGLTARNERHAARIAFDGWIQHSDMSPPTLVGIRPAPPRVS